MVVVSARGEVDFAQSFARDWVRRVAQSLEANLS